MFNNNKKEKRAKQRAKKLESKWLKAAAKSTGGQLCRRLSWANSLLPSRLGSRRGRGKNNTIKLRSGADESKQSTPPSNEIIRNIIKRK